MSGPFGVEHSVISKAHERKKAAAYGTTSAGLAATVPVTQLATNIAATGDHDHGVKRSKQLARRHPKSGYYKKELKAARTSRRLFLGGTAVTGGIAAGSVVAGAKAVQNIKDRKKT